MARLRNPGGYHSVMEDKAVRKSCTISNRDVIANDAIIDLDIGADGDVGAK